MAETLQGTTLLAGVNGVFIRGPSGSGKSSLALALIERGARLVADDRVHLAACDGRLVASAPDIISGLLELRGRGLVDVPFERNCVVRLVVDIVSEEALERMPDDHQLTAVILGIEVPQQPVSGVVERSLPLVVAALESDPSRGNMGLRRARVWG
jgi:HPr kinase/phosphorylase